MPGLSFLSKKSWHTSNISNQEKVWIAEQKAAAEDLKLKELTQQIKLEREQEELQKITGKKNSSTGDRGVDWMYEGHKKAEDDEERKQVEEDAHNEAYLLGKEYVPEGQTKHSGDFAVAASMTGALEKASTVGAMIGVAQPAGGMNGGREEEGEAVLRIQDDANNNGTAEAASSTMNEWNQNFHLRHEDPMFSVMQRKQANDKGVEKKIKLMERAGMVVNNKETTTKPMIAEEMKMKHYEQEDQNRDRRRRSKDSKNSKKKRKHKHHKSRRHHHHKKRSRRESSPSDDGYSSYSSSSSYSSEDSRRGRHHDRKEDGKNSSSRRHHDDDYDRHHSSSVRRRDRHDDRNHRRKSESRERRRRERSPSDYDRYERHHYKHKSSERRRERSRSYSMDREDSERRSRGDDYRHYNKGGDDSRSSRRENDRHKYDDRKQPAKEAASAPEGNTRPKKEGYGLIGTSLSNKGSNSNNAVKPSSGSGDYLGPDQKLREAKREEMERERQSRFGQGRKRRHGETEEERQMALEEMERNARQRY